jgi:hypothetical protein
MPQSSEQRVAEFGRQASPGSWFISQETEIEGYPELLPYSHYLRQAWTELKLSGVLCVDGRPIVYLCEAVRFTSALKRRYHRFAWNQALVPLLVFITPDQVEVHSTVKMPVSEQAGEDLFERDSASVIPNLGLIAEALEIARFIRSIETGQFFQDHADFFPADQTVDRTLLKNLISTSRQLIATGWDLPQAHALLGRALFVSFLHEREFIKPDYYPAGTTKLLDILQQNRVEDTKRLLYREFFPRLKREFNGTMFDLALAEEERHIGRRQLGILASFLGHQDMDTGQLSLGFWAYDFRYIPVEIISAIYEEFMKDADLTKKRDEGAYYTPRHLAETTLHIALEDRYSEAVSWRVLDPACGSGIFLVAMFNLLAELWRRENPTKRKHTKAQAMLNILQKQICGVDINPDACRIAAFSLYLALFEKLQPMDVEEFKAKISSGPFLPALLASGGHDRSLEPVISCADFLNDDLRLSADFDLVIGNPPWESRGKEQLALHFSLASQRFLRTGGVGCLLLPSTILVNRNGTLDVNWFRSVTVEKIVQLADFRHVLFNATHPCLILRYVNTEPSLSHAICYETPKLSRFDRRQGIIVVEPDDQKIVPQHDVLEAGLQGRLQSLWSRKFWGTPRDETFMRRLGFYPPLSDLVGTRGRAKRWLGGTGFQPNYENKEHSRYKPVDLPWKLTTPFIDARTPLSLVVFEDQFSTLGNRLKELGASTKKVLFSRVEENFKPPMVLLNNGFTKSAYCAHPVLFQDALRSITGKSEDEDILRFLAVVLESRLMQYLAFHSGSSNGIGRDKMHLYESLSLPFPMPDHDLAVRDADALVKEVAKISKSVEAEGAHAAGEDRELLIAKAKSDLEPLVESYYRVTKAESILIDDTLALSQPSIHRTSLDGYVPTLAFPGPEDRRRYADLLCEVLNNRRRAKDIVVSAEGQISRELNLIFFTVKFSTGRQEYRESDGEDNLWLSLNRIMKAAKHDNRSFSYLRGFSYFDVDRLFMLKPATMRNWSRTAALNDADAIFEHLVGADA